METRGQPRDEPRLCVGEIDPGHCDRIETQLGAPFANAGTQRNAGIIAYGGIGMIEDVHAMDDSGSRFAAHLGDEFDTEKVGAALAAGLVAGLVIYLEGNLGAGKTTLVRGTLRALGYEGKVKSPTYTLIEPYTVSRLELYHFDFYRFNAPEEYLEAGLDEYFSGQGACLVEWPAKAEPYIANADIEVRLIVRNPGRTIEVTALTETGRKCVQNMMSILQRSPP